MLTLQHIKDSLRRIPNYPKEGIEFIDITTMISQPEYFNFILDQVVDYYKDKGITKVVGVESRGFIFGGALASRLNAGFVPIRKPGKLPAETYSVSYDLEYGQDSIFIHTDALEEGDVVLLHDDLLATGGTTKASLRLLDNFKLEQVYINFVIELEGLKGRDILQDYDVRSEIKN